LDKHKRQSAILGLILLFLIILGDIISGAIGIASPVTTAIAGCNNPPSLEQCGTSSCFPTGSPNIQCSVTITFSPAFVTIPKFASAQYAGCNASCHLETQQTPVGNVVLQSDNGETWINMPAAKTEIYGTTNHEVAFNTSPSPFGVAFGATCITGSASATAVLRPEYSLDGGSSWNELASTTTALDLHIDASTCGFAASPAFVTAPIQINSAVFGQSVIFRIVGLNGNGVGDNVVLNNLHLDFQAAISEIYMTCIQGITFPTIGCGSGSPISKTAMTITITRMAPNVSGPGTAVAFNWMASE
jgi:hypothetical protein